MKSASGRTVQRQLYPAALSRDTLEQHVARHTGRRPTIYLVVVGFFLAACAMLPFLKVSLSVQSSGIIRPETEKHEVRARVSGVAERVLVRTGQEVRQGDPIAVLRSTALDERGSLLSDQVAAKERQRADLEMLSGAEPRLALDGARFQTPSLRQEYAQFVNELRDNALVESKAVKELDRARMLFEKRFATASELDERQYALDQARGVAATIVERARAGWQGRLATLRVELRTLRSQNDQLGEERGQYTVVAPTTGTVEELASISSGSFVQAGERVAVISPSSKLVAEVYVTPRNIGLVRAGAPVRMLIDAFNYNDWGIVSGTVSEISSDFVEVNGQPMFRVKCAMAGDYLSLRNGFVGRLKKGMTLRTRFIVAERSLLQLLHDNVNDWLNPVAAPAAVAVASRG